MSRDTIARVWREYRVQLWRAEIFKFSTDPQQAAKVHDVVGLHLRPPERAVVVLCVDEKSQIQALERTQPVHRVWPDRPEQRTHDYPRHGTMLFAALEVATRRVTNQCAPHHRHQEFLAFLKQVARADPRRRLHVICDNYATHTYPVVRSVDDLTTTISRSCQSWNQHCQPFSWTKPADQILAKLHRKGASATNH